MPINIQDIKSGQDFYYGDPPERFMAFGDAFFGDCGEWVVDATTSGAEIVLFDESHLLLSREEALGIFVFGSNFAGIHGAGAARHAMAYCGAKRGVGEGRTGASYAIPTKDVNIKSRSPEEVKESVDRFLRYAEGNPTLKFKVTKIGCGLAGFSSDEIAPMFLGAPKNCQFDLDWETFLGDGYFYWGRG